MRKRSASSGFTPYAKSRDASAIRSTSAALSPGPLSDEPPPISPAPSHRKDFAMPPPAGNLLARAAQAGREIVSIGKIGDIFAHRDTGRELKGASNDDHIDLTLRALAEAARRRLHLRQSRRFRHRFRPSPRRRRLCRLSGSVRRAPARNRRRAARRRFLRHHRRSRQRSDLARLRSHARTCADPRLRRQCRGRPDRPARNARRYRRDDRASARPARRRAWPELAGVSFVARCAARRRYDSRSAISRCRACF